MGGLIISGIFALAYIGTMQLKKQHGKENG